MLISDTHQFIFIHIPKTAGSSIRFALEPFALNRPNTFYSRALKRVNLPNDYRQFRFTLHSLLKDAELKMPTDVFNQYRKIAFVRNPWDRMVSSYAFKVHGTSEKKRHRKESFKDFIYTEFDRKKKQQLDYLRTIDGQLNCDFIGRYETLNHDYQALAAMLSIDLPTLTMMNKSKGRGAYREFYDDVTKKLIDTYFQEDIDTFKYTF